MTDIVTRTAPALPAMSGEAIQRVVQFEDLLLMAPQFPLQMQHVIHAGLYSRTVQLPPGVVITGALVKIPTLLIVCGDTMVWLGEEGRRITGYAVLPAAAGRKQAFRTIAETYLTMVFPTQARTVQEAEREFTDDYRKLAAGVAETIITGESACPE